MHFFEAIHKNSAIAQAIIITTALGNMSPAFAAAPDETDFEAFTQNLRQRYVVGEEMPRYSLKERMAEYGVPGVAIGVIKNGELVYAQGFGVLQEGADEKVDADTLFSTGSVSKIATATLIMKMQASGKLNVDENIATYLKSWQLPELKGEGDIDVSLRMLLSHTAGLNIHGFGDFLPGEALPTVYDTLNGKAPAQNEPLSFLFKPGTQYKYSGGGYTLAQLIVSDISGRDFPETASEHLFKPLEMTRSSFANPLPETTKNVAKAHNREGTPVALPRGYEAMPEMAASGLWTSANDLGQLVATIIVSYQSDGHFLPQNLASDMMTEVAPSAHGLGPRLEGTANGRFFHHGGANNSYKAWIEGHLATGNGLVVLTNGSRGDSLFAEIRNAAADTFGWDINKPTYIPHVKVTNDVLQSYTGQYQPDTSFPVEHREQVIGFVFDSPLQIIIKEGKLMVALNNGNTELDLIPTAPNRFLVPTLSQREDTAELVFHRNNKKLTQSMTLEFPSARSFYRKTP